jgi:alpha-galactosidase/6-phospho-beta-glucosidase family protein
MDVKLALVGGGGVRAPLFVQSALRRARRLGLAEICLMDTAGEQLARIAPLCRELGRRGGAEVRITATQNAREAFEGADFVVTTVRPGGVAGRIADERIALAQNVIGQETTGAGGFAMALRSIPAILDYAKLLREISPAAWLFNFTNPAGLVTQALCDAGIERCVGICDSANGAQNAVARWLGIDDQAVETDVFGLNHLSFSRQAIVAGEDRLAAALADDRFLATTALRVFEPHVVRRLGLWLNEYLYYYYYADRALADLLSGPTRGEEIQAMNHKLWAALARTDLVRNPGPALDAYFAYEHGRSASYMQHAGGGVAAVAAEPWASEDGEGYAGVALSLIEALRGGPPIRTALNVPNGGAIEGFEAGDVVEVSCRVDAQGIRPFAIGAVPEGQRYLVESVKHYERLTVEAVRRRSRDVAIEALVAHPLVLSYSRAEPLVDNYLKAHASYVGEWR